MLTAHSSKQVEFDPTIKEHQHAFVALTQFNRQHPTLRFVLEQPYVDVRSMMHGKVAELFTKQTGVLNDVRKLLQIK